MLCNLEKHLEKGLEFYVAASLETLLVEYRRFEDEDSYFYRS